MPDAETNDSMGQITAIENPVWYIKLALYTWCMAAANSTVVHSKNLAVEVFFPTHKKNQEMK
jgi:hypothetical protein